MTERFPPAPVQVLLIEDSADDALLLAYRLEHHEEPIEVTRVDSAFALQSALDSKSWDIVISDYRLPLLSGLHALELVRRHSATMPFILVSSTMGEDVAVDAMRSGANDFVMKDKLARLLPAFQRELRASRSRNDSVNERDMQRRRIEHLVHFDAATGLANRTLFEERLEALVASAAAERSRLAVIVVQFDRLATIAGVVGRQAGDDLIVQASGRLERLRIDTRHIARIDANRFGLILAEIDESGEAVHGLQRRLRAAFDPAFVVAGCEFRLDPRAGIAVYPDDGGSASLVLRNAEAAAAQARAGGEPYLFYAEQMTAQAAEKLDMENRLRRAIELDEFVLHYQPKVDIRAGTLSGVEALIRWNSPDRGLVYPAHFLPLLEETGLILEVGAWVLRTAAADYQRWVALGLDAPRIAVNVSVIQLDHPDFVAVVKQAISGTGSAPAIDLELTESLLMKDVVQSVAKLSEIRDLGVGISIDDFGTGYSSLAYLAKLPVVAVKIDLMFVAEMLKDPGTMRLVMTMIDLAHSLGLKAVAEGVEEKEQVQALRAMGCDEIQGYLVSHPVPFEQMSAFLAAKGSLLELLFGD
jgi:diguanylate cyclase (GGDEF)-like protein